LEQAPQNNGILSIAKKNDLSTRQSFLKKDLGGSTPFQNF